MKENKIEWCLKQKRGIKLIKQDLNLSQAYLKKADEALEKMKILDKDWKIITAYYACYNALYAILQKIGIKSQIHECSIELMKILGFDERDYIFMKNLKDLRIDVQYYLKEPIKIDFIKVIALVEKCKLILHSLNSFEIEMIRRKLKRNT